MYSLATESLARSPEMMGACFKPVRCLRFVLGPLRVVLRFNTSYLSLLYHEKWTVWLLLGTLRAESLGFRAGEMAQQSIAVLLDDLRFGSQDPEHSAHKNLVTSTLGDQTPSSSLQTTCTHLHVL